MSVIARVTVSLEIGIRQTWGDDCSVSQVQHQASKEARRLINIAIEATSMKATLGSIDCTNVIFLKD